MKIVILDGYTENPGDLSWDALGAFGELTIYDRTSRTDTDEIVARIGDAEIVITNKTPISKAVIDACPAMRYIAVLAFFRLQCGGRGIRPGKGHSRFQRPLLRHRRRGAVHHRAAAGDLPPCGPPQ